MRKLILILLYGASTLLLTEYFGCTNFISAIHPKLVRTRLTPSDSTQLVQANRIEKKKEKMPSIKQIGVQNVSTKNNIPDPITKPISSVYTNTTPIPSVFDTTNDTSSTTPSPTGVHRLRKSKPIEQIAPIFKPKDQMPFAIKFNKELSTHPILGIYLMPNEVFTFTIKDKGHKKKDEIFVKNTTKEGQLTEKKPNVWTWKAPKKYGIYPLILRQENTAETMILNCFVMIPLAEVESGKLKDYNIGYYPVSKKPAYLPPEGVIEVNKENENTLLSPNYKLKNFLSNQKQKFNYPNYVVLNERLLLKLELLTAVAQHAAIPFQRFTIMSAYRTPYYNTLNKNKKYSRHQWGMATDIFIDADNNYVMDDLNHDGLFNVKDSQVLYDLIDDLQRKSWYKPFIGGMGLYKENTSRSSFVHVDVGRGTVVRWKN